MLADEERVLLVTVEEYKKWTLWFVCEVEVLVESRRREGKITNKWLETDGHSSMESLKANGMMHLCRIQPASNFYADM